ncbi:RNA polymerase sporulation sigma factor SigK [Phosphitispora sp. TUW77]|uniref:RNA polymerase sporulation sigma factor SigK n=1 Tax=Phosphitispora sp. TUW77 TaxID=3152361 RepID=UPI003AB27CC1
MVPELTVLAAISLIKGLLLLISYITNNTFPQPLSEEEESKYLDLLAEGDEYARNILTEHNLRLVAHIVKKFDSTGEDNDDLISIGTIGLIKAINTYDKGKGTRLATYAARCIENEILMHLRAIKKNRVEISLYDSIGIDKEGNEISLIDVLGTDPEVVTDLVESNFEQRRLLEKVLRLNNREKNVLQLRFGLFNGIKKTQKEIARKLGISRSYVSRIEKRALHKLTKEFRAEGY